MSDFDSQVERVAHQFSLLGHQFASSFAKIGIPGSQFMMLRAIGNAQGIHPSQLAQTFGISLSAVTATVNRMEKEGLVSRRDDPSNRRQIFIEITAKGSELLQRARHERRQVLRDIFARFSEEDLEHFLRLIEKLNRP